MVGGDAAKPMVGEIPNAAACVDTWSDRKGLLWNEGGGKGDVEGECITEAAMAGGGPRRKQHQQPLEQHEKNRYEKSVWKEN